MSDGSKGAADAEQAVLLSHWWHTDRMFMDVRPRRVPGPLPQHGVQTQSGPLQNEAGTHSPRGPGCGLSKAAAIDQSFPLTSGKLTS